MELEAGFGLDVEVDVLKTESNMDHRFLWREVTTGAEFGTGRPAGRSRSDVKLLWASSYTVAWDKLDMGRSFSGFGEVTVRQLEDEAAEAVLLMPAGA